MRTWLALLVLLPLLALPLACDGGDDEPSTGGTAAGPTLPQGDEPFPLEADDFVARIDNRYWPMAPGSRWVYREVDEEGTELEVEVTVTDETKHVAGIEATVVHDVVTEDGELVEDTYDWYAQDRFGNVWYLGEDTEELEDGEVVSTAGSWEAGVDGALAGVIMPAEPAVGLSYRQEHYAGEAEDRAEVIEVDAKAEVPFGSYGDVVVTEDTTPLEPSVREHKYYAPGVGPVLTVDVAGGGREELREFHPGS